MGDESKKEEQTEFKKPVLIGRIGKLPRKAKSEAEKPPEVKNVEKTEDNVTESSSKTNLPPALLLKELYTPIPYKEPKWSGLCPDGSEYSLEVLKSGMIMDKVDLTKKPYYVFGRLANCDVVTAHPTISRHHSVLQYKAFAEDSEPPCGWYLFDLASTHGTFLNKEQLKPTHYTRVRVGHQIKFGNSTRTYIMVGPDFDCDGESELSVSEIKRKSQEMKLERDRMIEEAIEQRERDRSEEERKKEEQGIDWGMGEDAEEETDLAENPYAATTNEELYLEDPKKTLRGYFEREGHELSYDCEDRGVGQFICRVELPMDDARGKPVMAEVIHRGKKKEAVIACALEACRILDRAGLLRQSKHESRRRKQRDWSADDYYDSDDDTFLDRTGSVERKRKQRMRKHGAAEQAESNKPLTYDDLLNQVSDIESKISAEEKTLDRLRSSAKPSEQADEQADALDAFMSTLGKQSMAQKADISRTKMNIQKLKTELSKTQRLAEIARPAHLLPLLKKDDKVAIKMAGNSVVYGKRIRLKEDAVKRPQVKTITKQEETEFVEEVDSDEEITEVKQEKRLKNITEQDKTEVIDSDEEITEVKHEERLNNYTKQEKTEFIEEVDADEDIKTEIKQEKRPEAKGETSVKEVMGDINNSGKVNNSEKSQDSGEVKKIYGPMRPPENYVIPEDYFNQESDRDLPEIMEKGD